VRRLLRRSVPSVQRQRVDGLTVAPGVSTLNLLAPTRESRSALDKPTVTMPSIMRADQLRMSDQELVLGVECNGESRVYPTSLLSRPHIVNDLLGGRRIAVTFCGQCFSGVAFRALVDGRELTFKVAGAYQGAFTMRDDQTGTIWSQLSGEPLVGPLVGTRLELLPAEMTTLAAWMARHPESSTPDLAAFDDGRVSSPRLPPEGGLWWQSVGTLDPRLPPSSLVLGTLVRHVPRAYLLELGRPGPRLFQDQLAGVPIVLLAEPGSFPLVYERTDPHDVLELRLEHDAVVDQHGSGWSGLGRGVSGRSKGAQLAFLASHVVEWYAWAAHFPHTDVVDPNRTGDPSVVL
jgi:hypothetical protein